MEDYDLSTVLIAVGPRLRAVRRQRGTTLAKLSETTRISLSTLSRLESGQRKPTLELLLPLAKAYGVQLDELVGAPATGDPRVHLRPFTRQGMTFMPLTRHLDGLHAYEQVIPAGQGGCGELEQRVHEGYEWLYVLAGRLRLVLGEHDLVLTAGEAAEFNTRTPHAWASAGPEAVEFLSVRTAGRADARACPALRQVTCASSKPSARTCVALVGTAGTGLLGDSYDFPDRLPSAPATAVTVIAAAVSPNVTDGWRIGALSQAARFPS